MKSEFESKNNKKAFFFSNCNKNVYKMQWKQIIWRKYYKVCEGNEEQEEVLKNIQNNEKYKL